MMSRRRFRPTRFLRRLDARPCGTRFHLRDKGDECRARLVVQDYWRTVEDRDEIYASTPLLTTVKLVLLIALQFGYRIILGDISTAFLHAWLDYEVYVCPPKEYYPHRHVLWKPKRALYGLKNAPKAWQDYFAELLRELGGKRLMSAPNLY